MGLDSRTTYSSLTGKVVSSCVHDCIWPFPTETPKAKLKFAMNYIMPVAGIKPDTKDLDKRVWFNLTAEARGIDPDMWSFLTARLTPGRDADVFALTAFGPWFDSSVSLQF
jgi:hypothetical protein